MTGVPNAVRREGVYYFRRRVPISLVDVIKRGELTRSLRTNDIVLARSRSRRLYLQSEVLFGLMGNAPMLDDRQIAGLVRRFYEFDLEIENNGRLGEGRAYNENVRFALRSFNNGLLEQFRDRLASNDLHAADGLVDTILKSEGLETDLDPLTRAKLCQAVLRVSCDLIRASSARLNGDFTYRPEDPWLLTTASTPASTAAAMNKPAVRLGPAFLKYAEAFRADRERRDIWDGQTALQARKTYQLFAESRGDRHLADYDRDDAIAFKNLLCDLPADYGKAARWRGKKAAEIVDASKDDAVARLSPRTVQRHLSALACLWDTGLEAKCVEENIFRNLKLPSAKRPRDQRSMWPASKLEQLFDTPVWRGCQSASRRSAAGDLVLRDEKFWLPLIALFSGMRQEEICQLELADLREEAGILVFDIHGRGQHHVKNQTAVRLVPVHSALVGFGFLDFVRTARDFGHDRLFSRLERGGADRRFGHNYAKWFSRYRQDVGLYERGLDFHSLRHSATTFMAQAGVSSEIIDRVTGHVTAGETARYTKHFRIEQIRDAIEAIDPGIDLGFLSVDQVQDAHGGAKP